MAMHPDAVVKALLEDPENVYLVGHYRAGDTSIPSLVAGMANSYYRHCGEAPPSLSLVKLAVVKYLREVG